MHPVFDSARALRFARSLPFCLALALMACSDGTPVTPTDGGGVDQHSADLRIADQQASDGTIPRDGDPPAVDGGSWPDGAGKPGTISIFVAGDQSAVAFNDGLAGQTPQDYEIAISRYATLRSANDPAPVLCFDHGSTPVITNMAKDTFVGACDTSTIPTATYTHGRTKVDWARYTVDGVYHVPGLGPVAGKLTMFRAYSNTTYGGKSYAAGTGTLTVQGLPTPIEIPVTYPTPPSVPGLVEFQVVGGEFFMTFIFSHPLLIQQGNPDVHWARFHWKVKDAFRWTDRTLAGYQAGAWDIALDPTQTEVLSMYGVSGYYVTASTD